MPTKALFLASLFLCFMITIDAKADCTPTDIPGVCLQNAPKIPDAGLSDGLKAGAKGVEQLGNATVRIIENVGGDTIKTVETAGGDTIKTIVTISNDFTVTYVKGWVDGMEQARRSFQDAVDAAKAIWNFAENQAKSFEKATINANKRLEDGKFVDAMWHLGTDQIQDSEENFAKAAQESSVINTVAQTAAATYGGPAGAAAYTAWATYRATGDADLALRAGLISAITTQTGSSAAKLPSGTLGEALQKSAMAGAAGGIAVAAAGGDQQAVTDAFLKSSGAVLIQAGGDIVDGKIEAYSPNAKDAVESIQCISAMDVDCFSRTRYGRDSITKTKLVFDKKMDEVRIRPEKLDPQHYIGAWTALDPKSIEGQKAGFISKISKLPKTDAIPLMKNQWVLTWTLGKNQTIEHSKPAVVLTYVGDDVPFISKVQYGVSMAEGMYSCPVPGFNRTLTTTTTEESCETLYRREGGITQVIWQSPSHPDSCAAKAAAFITHLSDLGIQCSVVYEAENEDSVTDEAADLPVDIKGRRRMVTPVPADPINDIDPRVTPVPVERCFDRC